MPRSMSDLVRVALRKRESKHANSTNRSGNGALGLVTGRVAAPHTLAKGWDLTKPTTHAIHACSSSPPAQQSRNDVELFGTTYDHADDNRSGAAASRSDEAVKPHTHRTPTWRITSCEVAAPMSAIGRAHPRNAANEAACLIIQRHAKTSHSSKGGVGITAESYSTAAAQSVSDDATALHPHTATRSAADAVPLLPERDAQTQTRIAAQSVSDDATALHPHTATRSAADAVPLLLERDTQTQTRTCAAWCLASNTPLHNPPIPTTRPRSASDVAITTQNTHTQPIASPRSASDVSSPSSNVRPTS